MQVREFTRGIRTCTARWAFLLLVLISVMEVRAADYYWVGGSGNWTDISHWVSSSGGTTNYSQVPTPNDNVFFDANSFSATGQSITFNSPYATCLNLSFTGVTNSPQIILPASNSIKIYGSITLTNTIITDFQGAFYFESTFPGRTINMAGNKIYNDVYFQGLGGGWSLLDSLVLEGNGSTVNHLYGSLNTQGHILRCWDYRSDNTNPRSLILGSSQVFIMGTQTYGLNINTLNYSLNAGASIIYFVTSISGYSFSGPTGVSFYDIEFLSTSGIKRLHSTVANGISFHNFTLPSDGEFKGSQQFYNLNLSNDHEYNFESGSTYTFLNALNATGICSRTLYIHSSVTGNASTFFKASGTLTISDVVIYDIVATGSATFNALNSVSLGNTTGWNVIQPSARTLYWVGGSGAWADSMHWSLSSGGPGGACLPRPIDDVYFNGASFPSSSPTVALGLRIATCKSMNWTGAGNMPNFGASNAGLLRIYGSLTFIPAMNFTFNGEVRFEAWNSGYTITSATQTFKNDVVFDGLGGGWTLLDDFTVSYNYDYIIHLNGTLNTNSKTVSTGLFLSDLGIRTLTLMASVVKIESASTSAWELNSTFCTLNAGTSHIFFNNGQGGMINTGNSPLTYYDVTFADSLSMGTLRSDNTSSTFNRVTFNQDGFIRGYNIADSVVFKANKTYDLFPTDTLRILGGLDANGTCFGYIVIRCSSLSGTTYIRKDGLPLTTNFNVLSGVHAIGNAIFTAYSSIDIGNNTGWSILPISGVPLYWVGGTGNWDDPNHWSYTSGGIPGACLPTPLNDVIFDMNSFSATGQTVNVNLIQAFCRSMIWTGSLYTPTFSGPSANNLSIYGSLFWIPNMVQNFAGIVYFKADSGSWVINTGTQAFLSDLFFQSQGGTTWSLLSDMTVAGRIQMYFKGAFITNDYNILAARMAVETSSTRFLDLGSSTITLTSSSNPTLAIFGFNLTVDAGSSEFVLTGSAPSVILSSKIGYSLHDLISTNPNGMLLLQNNTTDTSVFNRVHIHGDATLKGFNQFDSLIFTPGNSYFLESAKTQIIVSDLSIRGNNCFPIILRSTNPGYQSNIFKATGTVAGDFIDMMDQNAYGGATFYTGNYSTNVGNNTGWLFQNLPGYVYGLGLDTTICDGDSITLTTVNFNGASSFYWFNGATTPTVTVGTAGSYWVQVTYVASCQLSDTILVFLNPSIDSIQVIEGIVTCNNGSDGWLKVNSFGSAIPQIMWSNGMTTDSISGLLPGTYSVIVSDTLCTTFYDTVFLENPQPLSIAFDSNSSYCGGQRWIVARPFGGNQPYQYTWSNSATTDSIWGLTIGIYTVTVTDANGCTLAASATVTADPPLMPIVASIVDVLCFNDSNGSATAMISGGMAPYQYYWNTTPVQSSYSASNLKAGDYTFIVNDSHGCTDSITVTISEPQQLNVTLQFDNESCYSLCDGSVTALPTGGTAAFTYTWNVSTPVNSPVLNNLCPGTYWVMVTDNHLCLAYDTIIVGTSSFITSDFTVDSLVGFIPLTVQFTFTGSGATTYLWDFGDGGNSTLQNPTYTYYQEGNYQVVLSVNSGSPDFCSDMHSDSINAILRKPRIYIPNTFTPNGDGLNDVFAINSIHLQTIHIEIFNRWGQLVHAWDDIEGSWDGTDGHGNLVPTGTYVYKIIASGWDNLIHDYTGTITLLR